ncbi:MAG: hypothetical protein H0V19_10560, partial [Euzebyales bacterium]|nr:hypothetical protein [Euzebyales bacterium]
MKDTAALAVGTVASGALAYAYFAVATRALGPVAAAPISVLWTYWSAAAAVLTFPLQHWTIRTLAADGHEGRVARALPRVWAMVAVLAVVSSGVAFAARETLFDRPDAAFPLMVAAVTAGSCLFGVVRGGLAGRGRFVATAWAIFAENGLRVALA